MADLADNAPPQAAATTGGYKRIQIDRGVGASPRHVFRASGTSDILAGRRGHAGAVGAGQRHHRYAGTGGYGESLIADQH